MGVARVSLTVRAERSRSTGCERLQLLLPPQPRDQPGPCVRTQGRRLALAVACQAGQNRLALGGCEGGALGEDHRVEDRLGHILEQARHLGGGLKPRLGRGAAAIARINIGGIGDAQHRVVRGMEMRLGEAGGVGRDEREIARISEIDQRCLRRFLDRIAAPCQLDIEPIAEQRLQAIRIAQAMLRLLGAEQPRERAVARAGQCDQPFAVALQRIERDMRIVLDRPAEVRGRDQRAQIVVAG